MSISLSVTAAPPASCELPGIPPLAMGSEIIGAIRQGAWIVFNLSGGKDSSAAMVAANIHLDRIGHPRDRRLAIHADLGRAEWASTPDMVERIARYGGVPLTVVRRAAGDLVDRWVQRFENGKRRYTGPGDLQPDRPLVLSVATLLPIGNEGGGHRPGARTPVCR